MQSDDQSDEHLFAAYRDGDMAAFDTLYARYRQPLYLFLLRRGHSEAIADDVFHDCWLKIIDQRSVFDGQNFRAWIFTITRNLSTDTFRRGALRAVEDVDQHADVGQHCSTQKTQEELDCVELMKSSVAALPMEQRDVFLLKQEADLSLQQLAELMAVGRETIKSRLRYAMQRLRDLMVDCL